MNIAYIPKENPNSLKCLPTSLLSNYILSVEEQNYIDTLANDTESTVSTLLLEAATRSGSTLCTQPNLNKLYARADDSRYGISNRNDFKNFMNEKMVGNGIVKFKELENTTEA